MAQNYSQSYGQKLYMRLLRSSAVDLAKLDLGGIGTGKFMDISTLMSNSSAVVKVGTGSGLGIGVGTAKAITKVAVASNVVTLTFGAAHGFAQGDKIVVSDVASPNAVLNGYYTVASVTASSPFTLTYALTTGNVTEASVTAGSVLPALKLDGTDAPIRLLGLTNITPNEGENEETVVTYDDEAKSYDTSIPTSKTHSIAVEGVIDYADAAYKLMRIASKESVREKLMIMYAITAPTGVTEETFGYGRFTGFQPNAPAGSIVKFQQSIRTYGPYELDF